MRNVLLLWVLALLGACASVAPLPPPADLLHDELFAPPAAPIDAAAAMALSPSMRQYLAEKITGPGWHDNDRRRRLMEALYGKGELRLEYDSSVTRTAAEAFEARTGNCLSLVMMTAAFAKEMGLAVRYQVILGQEMWDRNEDLYVAIGHVNLTLDERAPQIGAGIVYDEPMVVDFLPSLNAQRLHSRVVREEAIVAMYLNNRAVESLMAGRADAAYWWVREALRTDPDLMSSYITLAVLYRSTRRPELAEPVLARVLQREVDNTKAMSNQALVLRDLGRYEEAAVLDRHLHDLDPHPPFSYFRLGMVAYRERRFEAARDLFAKEVARSPEQHEFHFWLALTYLELKDVERASAQLVEAGKTSTTRRDQDRYALKLQHLKALTQQ